MKIVVNFITARQDWDPDTGEQTNFVVIEFAGRQYAFKVTEEELIAAIQGSRANAVAGAIEDSEDSAELDLGIEEREFGGDFGTTDENKPVVPPFTFQNDSTTAIDIGTDGDIDVQPSTYPEPVKTAEATPRERRKADIKSKRSPAVSAARQKLNDMKQRAKQVPQRKVPKDDMGYPIVQNTVVKPNGGPRGPEIEVIEPPPREKEHDEDGFGQA